MNDQCFRIVDLKTDTNCKDNTGILSESFYTSNAKILKGANTNSGEKVVEIDTRWIFKNGVYTTINSSQSLEYNNN